MERLAISNFAGLGMTDYLLRENIRDFSDLCMAAAGIVVILILLYCSKNYA